MGFGRARGRERAFELDRSPGRSAGPDVTAQRAASAYMTTQKKPYVVPAPVPIAAETRERIAHAYAALEPSSLSPDVKKSYHALVTETRRQARFIPVKILETKLDPYTAPGGADSRLMFADIRTNDRLRVFSGSAEHPLMTEKDNILFRAVHDYFGHNAAGNSFSYQGETNAYATHREMYGALAGRALLTETLGQNSYYNTFGQYAPQKAALLAPGLDLPRPSGIAFPPTKPTPAGFQRTFGAPTKGVQFEIGLGFNIPGGGVVDPAEAVQFIGTHLKGATIYPTQGLWEGARENSFIINVIDTENRGSWYYENLALRLKARYHQDSVLLKGPTDIYYNFL